MLIFCLLVVGLSLIGLNLILAPRKFAKQSMSAFLFAGIIFSLGVEIVRSSQYGSLQFEDGNYYAAFAEGIKSHMEGHAIWVPRHNRPEHWRILPKGVETYTPTSNEEKLWSETYPDWEPFIWLPSHTPHYPSKFDGPIIYPLVIASFSHFAGAAISSFIYVQVILLASLAQIIFLIGAALFRKAKYGWIAWGLILMDSGFLAIGAYHFKDTLIVWSLYLLALALLAMLRGSVRQGVLAVVIAVATIIFISLLRYPLYFSVILSLLFLFVSGIGLKKAHRMLILFLGALGVVGGVVAMGGPDTLTNRTKVIDHLSFPIHLIRTTFYRQQVIQLDKVKPKRQVGENAVVTEQNEVDDKKVAQDWVSSTAERSGKANNEQQNEYSIKVTFVSEGLLRKVAVGTARTFFAPYPWAIFKQGLIGTWPELFYPGMVMWILGLPLAFLFLPDAVKSKDPVLYFLLGITIVCAVAYIAYDGEYSTRVRLMSMPLAWLMVTGGVRSIWGRWAKS